MSSSAVSAGASAVLALIDVLERHRPDVVVTLDPTGSDGHRDHAAIGVAALPASIAFGVVWQAFGAPAAFGMGASLALAAALLLPFALPPERMQAA